MSDSKLYKEALVDAERYKKLAEENAKKAILEEFTPAIKEAISKQILGEGSAHSDEESEEEEILMQDCGTNESEDSDDVVLTTESIEKLARIAGVESDVCAVKTLKLVDKLESMHESKLDNSTYCEKLRQLKSEVVSVYTKLCEDKEQGNVSEQGFSVLESKLSELNEVVTRLYVESKTKLVAGKLNLVEKAIRKYKNSVLAEGYNKITSKAKELFANQCLKLTEALQVSNQELAELKKIAESKDVNDLSNKNKVLFKEIYNMSKKVLNEEEMKLIIKGLDMDDLEGSALTIDMEPMEDEMGDEMDMDDDLDMGDDDMGMDDDMDFDDDELGESELAEGELDEFGGKSYRAGGGRGRDPMRMARARSKEGRKEEEPKEEEPTTESELDEFGGMKAYSPGRRVGRGDLAGARSRAMRKGAPSTEEPKDPRDPAQRHTDMKRADVEETVYELDESLLAREIQTMKKKLAEMHDVELKATQYGHGPKPGFDDFGGGSEEEELFVDDPELNAQDPVAEGEELSEAELSELLGKSYRAGGGAGRDAMRKARARSKDGREDKEKKAEEEKAETKTESRVALHNELVEGIKVRDALIKKLKLQLQKEGKRNERLTLFNAKVVSANKLLQNENLSESKRVAIVKAIDKANNVDEVSRTYQALYEGLVGSNESLTENKSRTSVLGGSSKVAHRGSPRLDENTNTKEYDRWSELAGIKK